MTDAAVLDLKTAGGGGLARSARGPLARRWVVLGAAMLAICLALSGARLAPFAFARFGGDDAQLRLAPDRLREVSAMTVEDRSQIVAEGPAAQERNALIPASAQPVEAARRFAFARPEGGTYATALKCLTQAVYYEAATEPLQGRQAVAQVVLNRMRHPAYPKSVCGVVYQGSERITGCQFSFTCDGSLLRVPMAAAWRAAQDVARAALAGYVEPSVGTATHYHADYVLPKWAYQLGKIEQIGRHIFYRFNGSWGRPGAFGGRYAAAEQIPQIDFAALRLKAGQAGDPAAATQLVEGLTVPPAVTDRHAPADVGGRLDMTRQWRLSIPDPVAASSRYRKALGETGAGVPPIGAPDKALGHGGATAARSGAIAAAETGKTAIAQ